MTLKAVNEVHESMPVATVQQLYATLTMLSFISVTGTAGNALVLYVFGRNYERSSARIFILTLALLDLFTCSVIVPFTIAMEWVEFTLYSDFLCKLYHFFVTSTVPLSAFVMAAIAVDRCLCICRPYKVKSNITQVKFAIFGLSVLAAILGLLVAMCYGSATPEEEESSEQSLNGTLPVEWNRGNGSVYTGMELPWISATNSQRNSSVSDAQDSAMARTNETISLEGRCIPVDKILGFDFRHKYRYVHSVMYFVAFSVIVIMYSILYVNVRKYHRRKSALIGSSKARALFAKRRQSEDWRSIAPSTTFGRETRGAITTATIVEENLKASPDRQSIEMKPLFEDSQENDDNDNIPANEQSSMVNGSSSSSGTSGKPKPSVSFSDILSNCEDNGAERNGLPRDGIDGKRNKLGQIDMDNLNNTWPTRVNNNTVNRVRFNDQRRRASFPRLNKSPSPPNGLRKIAYPKSNGRSKHVANGSGLKSENNAVSKSSENIEMEATALPSGGRPSMIRLLSHVHFPTRGLFSRGSESDDRTPDAESPKALEKKMAREIFIRANLKTASMLIVVTVVFFVTFLPGALMAIKWVPFNMIVFYCYFVNNMANPIIYSFMNKNFRNNLKQMFTRRRR
ncbi:uncharacterized protein LOC106173368 [Lingula anatina]|uniref:Uncharacterized protein LOC106173368 n=1 Tax=Lingula anatina TaxID=7574 RepID=A0A1S3JHU5_LINAN|nr:uncharacterized protein LOC106173368 [Lingula anatina]|eukprot:XP_013409938.1 uncharacterized protein LOC106173368 [Lingula anatina]